MVEGAGNGPVLDWGVATTPLTGQRANGDQSFVVQNGGTALVAAIDALGHGPEAEVAALHAVGVLSAAPTIPIGELIRRCHQALLGRRGVVLSLAAFDVGAGILTWAGVGNVEGALHRVREGRIVSRSGLVIIGGVVGGDLHEVRPQQLPVEPGDLLVLATDGVERACVDAIDPGLSPERSAADLLQRFGKGTDDALVLVVRYRGRMP